MKRRQTAPSVESGVVPGWLLRFDPAAWPPGPADEWLGDAGPEKLRRHEYIRSRQAWSRVGRAWLAEHGYPVSDYFALVHSASAANCGIRLLGHYAFAADADR